MKKILTTMAMAAMACVGAHAQTYTALEVSNLFTYNSPVMLQEGGAVHTLGTEATSGYLIAFWWSADGSEGSYEAVGISTFADVLMGGTDADNAGYFYWASEGIFPKPTPPATGVFEGFLGMTVFRYDAGVNAGWGVDEWSAFTAGLTVASLGDTSPGSSASKIEDLWSAAQEGHRHVGEWWDARYTVDNNGAFDVQDFVSDSRGFGWDGNQYLDTIPEPSTWLMLGAGLAFVVVVRARRKP